MKLTHVGEVEIIGKRARSKNPLDIITGHTATTRIIARHWESCVGLPEYAEGVVFERAFRSHADAVSAVEKIRRERMMLTGWRRFANAQA